MVILILNYIHFMKNHAHIMVVMVTLSTIWPQFDYFQFHVICLLILLIWLLLLSLYHLKLLNNVLVLLKPVENSYKYPCRTLAPFPLRQYVFSAFHTSPSARHMYKYKTLHRTPLRSFCTE